MPLRDNEARKMSRFGGDSGDRESLAWSLVKYITGKKSQLRKVLK